MDEFELIRRYFDRDWACFCYFPDDRDFDFLIIDGPPTERRRDDGEVEYLPNGDLLELLPGLRPGCRIFVDGRRPTVEAYRRHVGDRFDIEISPLDYTLMELS